MKYIAYTLFEPEAQQREIWMAWLSDFPFESFEEQPDALKGYMPADLYETHKQAVDAFMQDHHLQFRVEELPDQDWNEVWESQFEPIEVEGCSIRAPFHPRNEACRYDLVVMPKMAFGTGHHATTCLMISQIMACDLSGAWGLDMGSGTGVLAMLAVLRGARRVDAVDIDPWAYRNGQENVAANGLQQQIHVEQGDASLLAGRHYDFVLANINRNILLRDLPCYIQTLSAQGKVILSGILEADIPAITTRAEELELQFVASQLRDGWAALRFEKRA